MFHPMGTDKKARCEKSILLFFLCCGSVSAQTPEACHAQLRHFTVQEYGKAFSAVPGKGGWAKLPSRLLFSEGGIEVYAGTFPDGRNIFREEIGESGAEVLVVYQGEAPRQAMIKQLREGNALPSPGMGALVTNLKYAKISFVPDREIRGKPFEEKWHISHLEYDEPQACLNVFQNDNHPTIFNPYSRSVWEVAATDSNKDVRLPIDRFPIWTKSLAAMLAWVKECSRLVDP
jgi:hypothetical protein